MKIKYVFVLIALVLFGFASLSSATIIINDSNREKHVYEIYNAIYGTSYTSSSQLTQVSDSLDNLWTETDGQVLLEVRYAGSNQNLGFFYNGSYTSLITDIPNGYNYISADINAPNGGPFYWVDKAGSNTWYSDELLNSDKLDHFIAFTTPTAGEYILAFEDWPRTLGDKDYNDLIVKVVGVAPVPEPSTFLLIGSGIIGLGLMRKRLRR